MKLIDCRIKNFRQHVDTRLTFDNGLIGIIGQNEAGKTTILESLAWVLFGSSAVRGNIAGIRANNGTGKAAVQWRFEIGGMVVHAGRIEGGDAIMKIDGKVEASSQRGVTESAEKLLCMNKTEFMASHFCRQGEIDLMPQLPPRDRKAFVERLFGIEVLKTAELSIRNEWRKSKLEVQHLTAQVDEDDEDALIEKGKEVMTNLNKIKENIDKFQDAIFDEQEKINKAKKALDDKYGEGGPPLKRVVEKRLASLRAAETRMEELEFQVIELQRERDQLTPLPAGKTIEDVENRQVELQKKLAAYNKTFMNSERRRVIVEEIADLENFLEGNPETAQNALTNHARYTNQKEHLSSRIARLNATLHSVIKEMQKQEDEVERIDEIRREGKPCPTCGLKGGDFDNFYTTMVTEVGEARLLHVEVKTELASKQYDLKDVTEKLKDIDEFAAKKWLAHYDAAPMQIEDLKKKLLKYPEPEELDTEKTIDIINKLEKIAFDYNRLQVIDLQVKHVMERVDDCRKQIALIPKVENELAQIEYAYDQIAKIKEWEASRDKNITEKTWANDMKSSLEAALDNLRSQVLSCRKRQEHLQTAIEATDSCKTTMDRFNEFSNMERSAIAPQLEGIISGMASIMSDGRHEAVTVSSDFGMTLWESGAQVPVASGGTSDALAFAMRVAISRLLVERTGRQCGLLILDEPFTSLDEHRRGTALSLLQELSDVFPQIIVISHIPDLKNSVDSTIELEHHHGITKAIQI